MRLGGTFDAKPVDGSTRRFSAVAYDAANDVYVVAWGLGNVGIRYVNSAGMPIGVPTNINLTTSGPPAVACSADQNMCLVAWLQEPSSIIGRLIRYSAGTVQPLTSTFIINSNGMSKLTSAAPDVAYSPVAGEFLVTWTEFDGTAGGPDVHGQRISTSAAPIGAEMTIAATTYWEGNTSLTYNSQQNEYLVGYYCEAPSGADSLCAQRVQPGTGALIGGRSLIYTTFVDIYPEIAYNSATNQYLVVAWGATSPWMLHGWRADGNLTPLNGAALSLAAQGGGDGLGIAYNPNSNTYLAVFQSQKNAEVWGVEIAADGSAGPQSQLTSSGTTLASQPAVAAGSTTFLAAASNAFTRVMAQLVGHGSMTGGTSGGGGNTGGCTTVQPGADWTCVNGGWLPPGSGPAPTSSCPTVSPGAGWTCVNGGWLPPGSVPTTTSSCSTVQPGAGWTCVNGGWLPPGSAPAPTSSCTTVQPGAGWTCVNGGWLPPGSVPAPTSSCTTVSPGAGWTCVNGGWLPPGSGTPSTGSTCKTVNPGPGWTCVNGGWLPPGSAPAPTSSCTTVSPGAGWTCVNGGWLPPGSTGSTGGTCTSVNPGPGWTCVNGGWLPPGSTTTTCTSVQPGAGWTCVNGGWLPPSTSTSSCTTVKPGATWTCVSGNWLPAGM